MRAVEQTGEVGGDRSDPFQAFGHGEGNRLRHPTKRRRTSRPKTVPNRTIPMSAPLPGRPGIARRIGCQSGSERFVFDAAHASEPLTVSNRLDAWRPGMSMWMREHRDGVTAMVATVSGRVYVAYTTDRAGMVGSMQTNDEVLEIAQASADQSAGCSQPCACTPWSELVHHAAASK